MPVNIQSGESPSRNTLPPPQPAAGDEEGQEARWEAELAAARSQAATLQQRLADAQQAAAAAEATAAKTGAELVSARAELAAEQAEAGQRAAQSARWASAADATTAELNKRIAALEDAARKAKAAAHDELVACRNSGMKVLSCSLYHEPWNQSQAMCRKPSHSTVRILCPLFSACEDISKQGDGRTSHSQNVFAQAVAELEARLSKLTKEKASAQTTLQRLESEVARLREGISRNRVPPLTLFFFRSALYSALLWRHESLACC